MIHHCKLGFNFLVISLKNATHGPMIAFTKSILYLEIALKHFTYSITCIITRECPIWGHYTVHCWGSSRVYWPNIVTTESSKPRVCTKHTQIWVYAKRYVLVFVFNGVVSVYILNKDSYHLVTLGPKFYIETLLTGIFIVFKKRLKKGYPRGLFSEV